MWSFRYKADYKERIEIGHLLLASPDRVLQWLKDNWTEPGGVSVVRVIGTRG